MCTAFLLHAMSDSELSRVRTELHQLYILPTVPPHPVQPHSESSGHGHLCNTSLSTHRQVHVSSSPALVEPGLFQKVQSVGRERSHRSTKLNRVFLLKGLIRCSDCGSWMTPHYTQKRNKDGSANRISYYHCTKTMYFNNSVCSVKHINADHVEGLVVGKLSELSQNDAYLRASVEELNRDLQRKLAPLEKEAQQIRKRLTEIEEEMCVKQGSIA
jgi:hypothetical protein